MQICSTQLLINLAQSFSNRIHYGETIVTTLFGNDDEESS